MADYKKGFGAKDLDYCVGLENLASLTAIGRWEKIIELTSYTRKNYKATYHQLKVSEGPRYELSVGEYDTCLSNFKRDVSATTTNKHSLQLTWIKTPV